MKVAEIDGGDGCIAMWMYLATLNGILKNGQNFNLCHIYFTTILKINKNLFQKKKWKIKRATNTEDRQKRINTQITEISEDENQSKRTEEILKTIF